jgi:Sulfatase
MGDTQSMQPAGARRWTPIVLIAIFALQSALRLVGMLPPFQRLSLQLPAVHALDLAAFAVLVLVLFYAVRERRIGRVLLALALGAIWLLLTAFDASLLLSIWFHQAVAPLATVPIFYCNAETIRACARPHPWLAVALGLVWLGLSGLIYLAGSYLITIGERLRRSRWRFVAAGFVVIWGVAWLGAYGQVSSREPLVRFVGKTPLGAQPRALMSVPRPDYKIAPTVGAQPRLMVLIIVDSLRADAVELVPGRPSRTPFLQELAASGKLHDYGPAVAICPTSYCGITGTLSSSDWATLQHGPPLMLPDVLAANGIASHYLLSGPHLRVLNLGKLYGPNVTTLLDDSSAGSSGLIDDREQVRRLKNLPLADPAHSFVFIHLMSAHAAGLRFDAAAEDASVWRSLMSAARYSGPYKAYYDRGVSQADLIVQQLFDVLKARSMLDDALVIITADHGERLDGATGHGGEVDLDTALIPLLVYDPRGGTWPAGSQTAISQTDVAPTLLNSVGIAAPPEWQGRALQANAPRAAAPTDTVGQSALVGRIDGRLAMLRCQTDSGELRVFRGDQLIVPAGRALLPAWQAQWRPRRDAGLCANPPTAARRRS